MAREFTDVWVPQLQFLDNGRIYFVSTKTRDNVSVSCPLKLYQLKSKELVVTLETEALTAQPRMNLKSLAPCSQEEADGRIFFHSADAAQRGNDRVLIRTVNTDIVVLAVTATQRLSLKIGLAFGTGKSHCSPCFMH